MKNEENGEGRKKVLKYKKKVRREEGGGTYKYEGGGKYERGIVEEDLKNEDSGEGHEETEGKGEDGIGISQRWAGRKEGRVEGRPGRK